MTLAWVSACDGFAIVACSDAGMTELRAQKSNAAYWGPKLKRNVARDAEHLAALKSSGWSVLVIWECETKNEERLRARLAKFLGRIQP